MNTRISLVFHKIDKIFIPVTGVLFVDEWAKQEKGLLFHVVKKAE